MEVLKSRCSTWILDVARSLPPTATLNGFDIDLSQCPSKSWLPGNVSMLILDALDELPLDLIAQFDLVHVRLFMFVVSDPVPLLANVIKLLSESKPAPTLNLSTELPKSYPCMILWPAKCSFVFKSLGAGFSGKSTTMKQPIQSRRILTRHPMHSMSYSIASIL